VARRAAPPARNFCFDKRYTHVDSAFLLKIHLDAQGRS
jgi:hypothetical protein